MQAFSTDSKVVQKASQVKNDFVSVTADALTVGRDVIAGQAALAVLRAFVVPAKVSLIDKLTGKGALIKKIANSTYGSLAIAATFQLVASMVNNQKLSAVAALAVKAATIEAASTLPIQGWVDKIAGKMFSNPAIDAVLGTVSKD